MISDHVTSRRRAPRIFRTVSFIPPIPGSFRSTYGPKISGAARDTILGWLEMWALQSPL